MRILSRILFPAAVMALTTAGILDSGRDIPRHPETVFEASADTVVYPPYNYRPRTSSEAFIPDSLLAEVPETDSTLTMKARLSPRDSLKALLDTSLWSKLDSIYIADSTAKAKAKFDAWYAGLSKEERRKYDREQEQKRKLARADSLRTVKEEQKAIRDSIMEYTPRILETYAVPDSMQYKRLIAWNIDTDFGSVEPFVPDTSYNYHFYDHPFLRNDVNATWLGVSGSPVQHYNYFRRESDEGVEFYDALESWSFSHRSILNYNTKTPHTELAYFGTLFDARTKESDNLHLFTTQNILPELNVSLLFDRYGGGGMLNREETANKTAAVQLNYLGKKYTGHIGFISNTVTMQENGGVSDNRWIRDTTVDVREIRVNLTSAQSKVSKKTFYLDQQLRIPFTFISKLKAKKDSSYVFRADSLDRDITTAYIGHSSELSFYGRKYTDEISDDLGRAFYNNVFNYNDSRSADSLGVTKLDNKIYLRLQPWAGDAVISKLDVGVGDYLKTYFDSTSLRPTKHSENSAYLYAGVNGQIRNNFFWDAKARFVFLGHDIGDFKVGADGRLDVYPFRRARKSPVSIGVHFETSLLEPTFYQQTLSTNHFKWDNDFGKISTTKVSGKIDIPRFDFSLEGGYALVGNGIYYDAAGIVRQNEGVVSILSASLRKDIKLGPVHLDNRLLAQYSSNSEVVPLPLLAANLKYYLQFTAKRNNEGTKDILTMQIGLNAFWNTSWNSPAWNPNIGVFYNQNERSYNNGPYFDIFVNMQWKRASIFVKYQNAGGGWPMTKRDFFSADRHIITSNGMSGLKFGIFWPFYTQPTGRPQPNRN